MLPHLANPSSPFDPAKAAENLRTPLLVEGTAARTQRPPADALSPLEALPWFAPSGPRPLAERSGSSPAAAERLRLMLNAGLAVAVAGLLGSAWYLSDGTAGQNASLEERAQTLAARSTEAWIAAIDQAAAPEGPDAAQGEILAALAPAPTAADVLPGRPPAASGIQPAAPKPAPVPATAAPGAPSSAAVQMVAVESAAAAGASPAPQPVTDRPATTATLREFRALLDENRDAIREVIRLGNRQRPGRDASAAELASYRLRQQNAEAARTYRGYLDTLARSVRRSNSETATRQSLERARQTLGYVSGMLSDSKAALR
ncbi:MAG: hypothetical protein K2Q29_06385 [Sphingomonadales bacterium]|nr:hypothetical protein [Sphingomonadales bacterium]